MLSPLLQELIASEDPAIAALERADSAWDAAQAALREGDLATYQTRLQEAKTATDEAMRALGVI